MKILMCHNYYQQPGGEDQSYEAEVRLLESRGHEVVRFTRHNDDIREMSRWKVACGTLWNRESYRDLRQLIRRERPEMMHCTNIFPLISPQPTRRPRPRACQSSSHSITTACSAATRC